MTLYTLENVRQRYGAREVLCVPSMTIDEGEVLALVGPSGAGKSTLLRLLAFLEAPTMGQVGLHLNGTRPVTFESATIDIRRQIAVSFQRPLLLSRSVRANVAYGLTLRGQKDDARVDAMLERLKLDHLADARPRTLSGGEIQRVSLARAMLLQPRVLLLDEPTANLDPHNITLIETFLQEQRRETGITLVIVTHNIYQARRLADRVALLYEGDLVEVAPKQIFFDTPADARTQAFVSGTLIY
ncbi:MAG TPA: ATP-binding cassette domain-containing protein [Aggregatilinea sp.]|jgi:tungstate transport system ATP-binding protein|uniref:ATP-binding cassette domain-containing protein n=1 Tax=Aggregatilinea sp. TaxID=2806333 RepID=UPI002B932CEC|nr:ATP-binding cassette domain-containing protein [Aggregatilinea sp.]HML22454.1 ATP-binding cassette domain-containing protein [Aggregatilinea sp.]